MQRLKVIFYLKGEKSKDGKSAIYGKIKLGTTSCTFSTGKYILKDRWEKTNGLRNALRVENEISLKESIYSMPIEIERAYTR